MLKSNTPYLVMMDMDSTLIQNEVIDDLAVAAGVGEQVSEITESAMRGELDFTESLRRRVALLAGSSIEILEDVANKITLTPGAEEMINQFAKSGFKTCVVSGGFDVIIEKIVKKLGIDSFKANTLEIKDGKLTGQLLGEILDAQGKRQALIEMAEFYAIPLGCTIAIGDGANDIPMIEQASVGIAFNAKPALKAVADISIEATSLQAVIEELKINNP
jgi:phosphoserine phosphatase